MEQETQNKNSCCVLFSGSWGGKGKIYYVNIILGHIKYDYVCGERVLRYLQGT